MDKFLWMTEGMVIRDGDGDIGGDVMMMKKRKTTTTMMNEEDGKKTNKNDAYCFVCGTMVGRKNNLFRHWARLHGGDRCVMDDCDVVIRDRDKMFAHYRHVHRLDGRSPHTIQKCDLCISVSDGDDDDGGKDIGVYFASKLELWKHECAYHPCEKADEWVSHPDVDEEEEDADDKNHQKKRASSSSAGAGCCVYEKRHEHVMFDAKKAKMLRIEKDQRDFLKTLLGGGGGACTDDVSDENAQEQGGQGYGEQGSNTTTTTNHILQTCMDPVILT
jgi:hypothetical protein